MAIGNAPGNPLSVFLVEDEVMIRMMVSDMLVELGHRVTAEAGDLEQAIRLAQTADFSLAILDVNLADKLSTPVADIVNSLGRPIIFASGYGSSGLPQLTEICLRCKSHSRLRPWGWRSNKS